MASETIIIVEDELLVAEGIKNRLNALGYSDVSIVTSGLAAITATRQKKPDLVLMDIRLDGPMDGIEAARTIRSFSNVPLIYLTAYASDETVERVRETNPCAYLLKPFNERELDINIKMGLFKAEAEKRLSESEHRFRTLVELSSDFIWQTDVNGVYTYVSPKVRDLLGYEPAELVEKTLFDLMMPDHAAKAMSAFRACVESKSPIENLENINLHKNGTLVVLQTCGVPVIDADGKLIGYRGVDRDITALKQAEVQLIESKELLETIFDTSADGILVYKDKEFIVKANSALTDITGYTNEEIIGMKLSELVFNDEKSEQRMSRLRQVIREHGPVTQYESVWQRKDGSLYPVENQISLLQDNDANVTGMLAVVRDITERKSWEKELEKKVEDRTAELKKINEKLKERESELVIKTENLNELNTALRVLIDRRGEEIQEAEEKILFNIKELVTPHIRTIREMSLDTRQKAYLDIVESNLNDVLSPFLHKMSAQFRNLTPTEIKVANLIRQGNTTKSVAEFLSVSKRTIDFYRENIRKKLGLKHRKTNLRSYLMSLQ